MAPHSAAAEQAILGACLLSVTACHLLATELGPDDFYVPKHQAIAQAILDLHLVGAAIDPVTVAGRLDEMKMLGVAGGVGYLIQLQAEVPSRLGAGTYASTVRDRAARRELVTLAAELTAAANDLDTPVDTSAADFGYRIQAIDAPTYGNEPDLNIAAFIAEAVEYRWLVPGLLERGDRMLLTGGEGLGKSTLLKQLAVQFAAGIHPWFPTAEFTPIRTLIVDVENSRMQVRRMLERLYRLVTKPEQSELGYEEPPPFDPDMVRVRVRPQGINLLARADRRWFTEAVVSNRPDLVVTGPLYKLHRGKPNDEEPAAEVANYLDELRAAYDLAIIIEAHSPHATDGGRRTVRPFGASLWLRWPEFGYGLRRIEDINPPVYEWVPWRGPRDDERTWPARVKRGPQWPWINAYEK